MNCAVARETAQRERQGGRGRASHVWNGRHRLSISYSTVSDSPSARTTATAHHVLHPLSPSPLLSPTHAPPTLIYRVATVPGSGTSALVLLPSVLLVFAFAFHLPPTLFLSLSLFLTLDRPFLHLFAIHRSQRQARLIPAALVTHSP